MGAIKEQSFRAAMVPFKGHALMTVMAEDSGNAVEVRGEDRRVYRVAAHSSLVPVLRVGDLVIVVGTPQGVVVMGRLRATDERPMLDDRAHALHWHDSEVTLSTDRAKLALHTEKVSVTACEIGMEGEEQMTLSSARLALNP